MFGILYTVSGLIGRCASNIRDFSFDCSSKAKAKSNNKNYYYDHNGAKRIVSNDKQIYDTILNNGDRVTKDIDGNILNNIDKEIRLQKIVEYNNKLEKENSPVRCLGYFYDLYNEEQRKGILKNIPKKEKVYKSISNNVNYIREMSKNNNFPEYVYINLNNGNYEFLDECNETAKKWLEQKNRFKTDYIIKRGL